MVVTADAVIFRGLADDRQLVREPESASLRA
jgi:hypothetical protein